jgi:FkbM family methyltransferase
MLGAMSLKGQAVYFVKQVAQRYGIEIRRAAPEALGSNILALAISDVVVRILMNGGRTSDFTFVQIGANDGVSNDPIRKFVLKYQMRGVLVEPQPDVFARLQRNYEGVPGVTFENAAIAAKDGQRELYRFRPSPDLPQWAHGLASFSKETLTGNLQNVKGEVETIHVPTLSFGSLLRKHNLERVDLLQIDAEGFDFEIIKMVDFSTVRPAIIHFEHGFLSREEQEECCRYLNKHGYMVNNNDLNTLAYAEPQEQRLVRDWIPALSEQEREMVFGSAPQNS